MLRPRRRTIRASRTDRHRKGGGEQLRSLWVLSLVSRETVVELIASTTTQTGLTVRCELDTRDYPKGIRVSDAEMTTLNIRGDIVHPVWNYTLSPRPPTSSSSLWASPNDMYSPASWEPPKSPIARVFAPVTFAARHQPERSCGQV